MLKEITVICLPLCPTDLNTINMGFYLFKRKRLQNVALYVI